MKFSYYTEKELQFLKDNYPKIGAKKCSQILGRTESSIYYKARKLKLKSDMFVMNEEKLNYVKNMVINHNKNLRELSLELDVNYSGLRQYCINNGFDFKKYITKYSRYKNNASKDGGFKKLLKQYTDNAKIRNIEFSLSTEDFSKLVFGDCYYCNKEPINDIGNKLKTTIYNGIDRVDNSLGYTKDNSVTCCTICNFMKRDLSLTDFFKQIETIFNLRIKG